MVWKFFICSDEVNKSRIKLLQFVFCLTFSLKWIDWIGEKNFSVFSCSVAHALISTNVLWYPVKQAVSRHFEKSRTCSEYKEANALAALIWLYFALHSLFAFIYLLPGLCTTRKFIVNNPCHGLQMQVEEEAFKEILFYICGVFLDEVMIKLLHQE